ALRAQEAREPVPAGRRVADAKRFERLVDPRVLARDEASLLELLERVAAVLVLFELLLEVRRGERVDRVQLLARLLPAIGLAERAIAARLLDGDARALGEHAHGLRERVALVLDQEIDRAPRLLAPEAMEEPAIGVHVEARRLLLVEGTQAHERPAPPLQR